MMAAWNTETNFDVLKDLATFLNSITESKLMLGKAQSGQKALNKYLKNKKLGINLKKKKNAGLILICFLTQKQCYQIF